MSKTTPDLTAAHDPTAAILIIDDEPEVCRALMRVLTGAGFRVTVVGTAIEGIEAFERDCPAIVITDIIMPKINGLEAIASIRSRSTSVGIIAISGGGHFGPFGHESGAITTQAYSAAAFKAGADEVLSKPFDRSHLLACVHKLLTRS